MLIWGCLIIFAVALGIEAATTGVTVNDNQTGARMMVDDNWVKYGNKAVDNKIRVVSETYLFNVGIGAITNHVPVHLFGHTDGTKLNTLVDLSHLATDAIPVPVAMPSVPVTAVAMEVVSTDVDDYTSGTGARSVYISGLDLDGNVLSETLVLAGASGTGVTPTVGAYSRVNCFLVATAGTSAAAEGTITLRHVNDTPVYSAIPALFNESNQAHFTVPAGQKYIIKGWSAGATGKDAFVYLQATVGGCSTYTLNAGIYRTLSIMAMASSNDYTPFEIPIVLPSLTDVKVTSESTSAAGGTASANLIGFYEPN